MNERVEQLEKQILELKAELQKARAESEPHAVKDYEFATIDGTVKLSELFGGMDDLLVIHNMGKSCKYCALWADGMDGYYPHLSGRAALVLVSPDDPETQREFAAQRGWRFPTVSDTSKAFTSDMGMFNEKDGFWPGVSAFRRDPDGTIKRKNKAFFGPGDDFCAVWPMMDLLEDGVNGWEPS